MIKILRRNILTDPCSSKDLLSQHLFFMSTFNRFFFFNIRFRKITLNQSKYHFEDYFKKSQNTMGRVSRIYFSEIFGGRIFSIKNLERKNIVSTGYVVDTLKT